MCPRKIVYDLKDPRRQPKLRSPAVNFLAVAKKKKTSFQKIRMPEQKKRRRRKMAEHQRLSRFLARYFAAQEKQTAKKPVALLDQIHVRAEKLAPTLKRNNFLPPPSQYFWPDRQKAVAPKLPVKKRATDKQGDLELDIVFDDLSLPPGDLGLSIDLGLLSASNPSAVDFYQTAKPVITETFYPLSFGPKGGRAAGWQKFVSALKARPAFALAAVVLLLLIPAAGFSGQALKIKASAQNYALAGYNNLLIAKKWLGAGDFERAGAAFSQAADNLATAKQQVDGLVGRSWQWLAWLPGLQKLVDQNNVLLAAKNISLAGQTISFSLAGVDWSKTGFFGESHKNETPTEILAKLRDALAVSYNDLQSARQNLADVSADSLPASLGTGFLQLKTQLGAGLDGLAQAPAFLDNLLSILGQQRNKKYLLLFQNSSEIRATGGFIGSYAVFDFDRGEIKNLIVDDVFNPDGQLAAKIRPPGPIQKISANWSMHDANWFADFPTSARKVADFYEKTGGPTTDGVLAITPRVLENLLGALGPVSLPQYNLQIDQYNFIQQLQFKVEADFDQIINQPKQILADLAPVLFARLEEEIKTDPGKLINILLQALQQKQLLIYFRDPALEEFAQKQGWGGELRETSGDFLMVVNSNINGYKTDYVMAQSINHQIEITASGEIFDTLQITRRHQGGDLADDWYNRVNADYFRVYVPPGAQLLSASGQTQEEPQTKVDYAQENYRQDRDLRDLSASLVKSPVGLDVFAETGKTVFGGWAYTSPGEQTDLSLRYKLPFTLNFKNKTAQSFSLTLQKQPGMENSRISVQISFPLGHKVSQLQNNTLQTITTNQFDFSGQFDADKFFGFVVE